MRCYTSCSLSAMFIIGMIYFYNTIDKSNFIKSYKLTLSPELKDKYETIIQERKMISYKGYFIGFLLSLMILFLYKFKLNKSMICIIILITCITNYFFYILSPKSDSMIHYLKTPQELENWHNVYKWMQYNYHLGIVLGIVAVGFMGFAFKCD